VLVPAVIELSRAVPGSDLLAGVLACWAWAILEADRSDWRARGLALAGLLSAVLLILLPVPRILLSVPFGLALGGVMTAYGTGPISKPDHAELAPPPTRPV
jgi:hypothetical protein